MPPGGKKSNKKKTSNKRPARAKTALRGSTKKTSKEHPRGPLAELKAAAQSFVSSQFTDSAMLRRPRRQALSHSSLVRLLRDRGVRPTVDLQRLLRSVNSLAPNAGIPEDKLPEEVRESLASLRPRFRRLHGAKVSLLWFPWFFSINRCADKFGYMSPAGVRTSTKLPFKAATQALLGQLGDLMGNPGRETAPDSTLPAGFTYIGQFIDHDITLDISSSLDESTDANSINNMRTPVLDLDSVYGRGPALDPFLYDFPESGPSTAIRMKLGSNQPFGPGGPAGSAGNAGGMQQQVDFDVPRVCNPANPAASSQTAIIGDPRNDENLIVSQFHQTMLRFHNAVGDLLLLASFSGDIFVEAKRIVTQHYQWAVVHDFLRRICGEATVSAALSAVSAPMKSGFRMPVEFAVGAYRFGHSMIRDNYWLNFNFPNASLGQVFEFVRTPRLPVFSNWVVDFNAFLETGVSVPVFNHARPIDSVLANELERLPGFTGLMAVLAKRNLRRGLALGLPSGQGMAGHLGVSPMTETELKQGLPAEEAALLDANSGLLKKKTPLWYYVLREATVLGGGNQLGPVGGTIVARTFARMLKRDPGSYLNAAGGFTPMLPSQVPGDFTFADLVTFAGVTQP